MADDVAGTNDTYEYKLHLEWAAIAERLIERLDATMAGTGINGR